jgi:glycosyltransferase involved in cell wall biosynthesis
MASLPIPQVISFMGDDVLGDFDQNGRTTIRSYLHKPFAWIPTLFADQIIVKSLEMAKCVQHRFINVVPNGVDFRKFYPIEKSEARRALGLRQDKKYILFPGDIESGIKRFSLAKSSSDIINHHYHLDHSLLHMRSYPQETLNLYFNAVDVMVFTSWSEGSPNVVKEAMACNLPIVSVRVGDTPELISNARQCFLVSDDADVIAECLFMVLQNPQRSNGREVIRHLELSRVAQRLEQVYYRAIGSPPETVYRSRNHFNSLANVLKCEEELLKL